MGGPDPILLPSEQAEIAAASGTAPPVPVPPVDTHAIQANAVPGMYCSQKRGRAGLHSLGISHSTG